MDPVKRLKLLAAVHRYAPFEGVGPFGQPSEQPVDLLEKIISRVVGILTVVAAIFFIFQFIFAGYSWISAAGDAQKVKQAQDKMWQSIMGLVLVIFALALVALLGYLMGGVDLLNLKQVFS